MQRADFAFHLPPEQVAQQPPPNRSDSRLLVMDRHAGGLTDQALPGLARLLEAGDLLVFNDTRVINARLFGTKASGGRVGGVGRSVAR